MSFLCLFQNPNKHDFFAFFELLHTFFSNTAWNLWTQLQLTAATSLTSLETNMWMADGEAIVREKAPVTAAAAAAAVTDGCLRAVFSASFLRQTASENVEYVTLRSGTSWHHAVIMSDRCTMLRGTYIRYMAYRPSLCGRHVSIYSCGQCSRKRVQQLEKVMFLDFGKNVRIVLQAT